MGEDSAPRSAGCSSTYSAPAACAGRDKAAVRRFHDVAAIADGARSAVRRFCTREEPGLGEGGARRGREDRRIVAVRAPLQEPFVQRVNEHIVRVATSACGAIVLTVRGEP
eukprot:6176225-Pleurochrysis_carterae.AAC.4